MRLIIAAFLLFGAVIPVFSQQIDFYREEITFELDSLFFTVNGDYYFRNTSDNLLSPKVTFPIASSGSQRLLDTIMVFAQENLANPVPVTLKDTLARFTINLPPESERMFKVIYRQRHNGSAAKYILTSTNFWKKPIEDARYSLVVPHYIDITGFSIPPDSDTNFGDRRIYYWKKAQFMPDKEFILSFTIDN